MSELSDLTTACIRCGFCLESCPTFVETGEETESPRGRIYLVRSAEAGTISWESTREHLDQCLGCRACEPACPSNVHYGQILELARAKLEKTKPDRWRRILLDTVTSPRRLKFAQRLPVPGWLLDKVSHGQGNAVAPLPKGTPEQDWPPLNNLPPIHGEVALLEGCAMRQLFPRVHQATRRLIRRAGFEIAPADLGCCGALHAHSGHLEHGQQMALDAKRKAGQEQIITNSAGCGSWLKDSGLDAVDISEFLSSNPIDLTQAETKPIRVTYHDACHLAHGQRITRGPRDLIRALPGVELIEMPESDRCCGSAGTYNVFQPRMAKTLLERKLTNIESTNAEVVILGNPGCHAWIAQGDPNRRPKVLHLAEFLESRLSHLTL